jgi:hypothetical protein
MEALWSERAHDFGAGSGFGVRSIVFATFSRCRRFNFARPRSIVLPQHSHAVRVPPVGPGHDRRWVEDNDDGP